METVFAMWTRVMPCRILPASVARTSRGRGCSSRSCREPRNAGGLALHQERARAERLAEERLTAKAIDVTEIALQVRAGQSDLIPGSDAHRCEVMCIRGPSGKCRCDHCDVIF